ncbi:hypothetical protein E2C01_037978 [Portunus trituberculatus]|uniref:Uncharacterized protein n=1 Tax=Portunus trituberculatus TaxID=210409 RepID=A0A5B7FG14_PORTR|nr:hypothetical protein [Portunus trituberculatus]
MQPWATAVLLVQDSPMTQVTRGSGLLTRSLRNLHRSNSDNTRTHHHNWDCHLCCGTQLTSPSQVCPRLTPSRPSDCSGCGGSLT